MVFRWAWLQDCRCVEQMWSPSTSWNKMCNKEENNPHIFLKTYIMLNYQHRRHHVGGPTCRDTILNIVNMLNYQHYGYYQHILKKVYNTINICSGLSSRSFVMWSQTTPRNHVGGPTCRDIILTIVNMPNYQHYG